MSQEKLSQGKSTKSGRMLIPIVIAALLSLVGVVALALAVQPRQVVISKGQNGAGIDKVNNENREKTNIALAASSPKEDGHRFFKANCAVCHGGQGSGGFGPDLRSLVDSDRVIIGIIKNGKGDMPAFAGKASNAQIDNVLAFIRTLKK